MATTRPDPVLRRVEGGLLAFRCPGCEREHAIRVEGANAWGWNGSLAQPSITPSVLAHGSPWETWRCHSFVTEGRIQFLTDSTHALAGQTVDLPGWPDEHAA